MIDRRLIDLPAAMAIVMLAGCSGGTSGSPPTTQPSPVTTSAAPIPSHTPKGIPIPTATVVATSDPAAVVRATVTAGDPRLLPTYVPAGMSSFSVRISPISYTISYTDDQHTRDVLLAVNTGANPPPITGSNGSQTHPQFRGVRALYQVYDATAATSQRYLLWQEPGTWSQPMTTLSGIEYFLVASGLTETEFWRVADSLKAVP